jgi:hypothetical protein
MSTTSPSADPLFTPTRRKSHHDNREAQVISHTVRRLDVPVPASFDEVIRRYEQLVPAIDVARFGQLATWDGAVELAEINAPMGFMLYWKGNVTASMAGSQYSGKCAEYLMGNHVIAERMCRHDPSVMLHAPLRTAIYADDAGDTHFVIDQPSTFFNSYDNPAIAEVGQYLDNLVAGLLEALDAPVPAELG